MPAMPAMQPGYTPGYMPGMHGGGGGIVQPVLVYGPNGEPVFFVLSPFFLI